MCFYIYDCIFVYILFFTKIFYKGTGCRIGERINMKKIVLIGAGSQNFGLGVIGDIFKSKTLEGSKISGADMWRNSGTHLRM